jgi:hypothetical protein
MTEQLEQEILDVLEKWLKIRVKRDWNPTGESTSFTIQLVIREDGGFRDGGKVISEDYT